MPMIRKPGTIKPYGLAGTDRKRLVFQALLASVLLVVAVTACQRDNQPIALSAEPDWQVKTGLDRHSFAEFDRVRIEHLKLSLRADMQARIFEGFVVLDLERIDPEHRRLVLDTRDLDVREVHRVGADGSYQPATWRLASGQGHLGSALIIVLAADTVQVRVDYATHPQAYGLQWLDAAQTSSGKPFVFSQSQPHFARTWVPLQDTPAVRYTFEASIRAPRDLMVVMGADGNPAKRASDGAYSFTMPQAVPSYLMAIAIGDLRFAKLGPRTGVFAEPGWIDAAAREFHDLEAMVEVGERLYGAYRWGRYDLLILPPSFPFGGMENPRLSFITPTIIAGDGSLVALIAHELAHSWSGNLVTNASWRDLWLNEGFTTYLEARIMEVLHGPEIVRMLARLDWDALQDELSELDAGDRQLVLDLDHRDPELAFNGVPYNMGRSFLDWLEHHFGRPRLDEFLRSYFDHFAFQSISTEQFRVYLNSQLLDRHPGIVTLAEVDAWLYEPGLPEHAIAPQSDLLVRVDEWSERWRTGVVSLDAVPTEQWSVYEWLHFLTGLEGRLGVEQMGRLDARFDLTAAGNVEILYRWLRLSIETRYPPGIDRLERFLLEVGRNKFVRPLYEALAGSDWGRAWAVEVYRRARPGYHAMTRQAAERALGLNEST